MDSQEVPKIDMKISVIREPGFTPMTSRKREVCWDFGIPPREEPFTIAEDLPIMLRAGSIVVLTGPSGSGKSSLLWAVAEKVQNALWVGRGRFPSDRSIVDIIAPRKPLATALEILTACGLGEPRLWVRQFGDLSEGERFRAWLARAVGQSVTSKVRGRQASPILCDEFTAILHRRAAKAIAYNLRKLVSREGLMLVVATTHDDIIEDLQPDQIIRLEGTEPTVSAQDVRDRVMSLRHRATIEPGSVKDYRIFSPMHYRNRDGLGFVDKVFLLKESRHGEPLGILVFAHAPLELAQRNRCTGGRFVRNPRRLNRELRILRRLVMHPDVRGCGLGHWFVKKTLPQVGVRFVECLAAMGAVNPVFERAGMSRVGRCPIPRGRMALLKRMEQWHIDPFAPDFARRIARYPRVRRMVEETVQDWINATQGAKKCRAEGRPPAALARTFRQIIGEPPVYYLWDERGDYPLGDELASGAADGNPGTRTRRETEPDHEASRTARAAARRAPRKREATGPGNRRRMTSRGETR
ncbi:MAG: hypothetical protein JXQ75_12465 [Phycisphaerae bacterium]|nr:hypothetical protein [Phycisphaerae bacterium]